MSDDQDSNLGDTDTLHEAPLYSSEDHSRSSVNPPEPDFVDKLLHLVNQEEVEDIGRIQRVMLNRFEKTNQMLVNCNELSAIHFAKLSKDFRGNTAKLAEMYRDLDWIFHHLRALKKKVAEKYPELAEKAQLSTKPLHIDEEEEEEGKEGQSSSKKATDGIRIESEEHSSLNSTKTADEIRIEPSNAIP